MYHARRVRLIVSGLSLALLLAFALPAWAQEVGTVAALDGIAEIGRGGTWSSATLGGAIALGDELRTGSPGHIQVVLQDDSVLTLGDDSLLTVDEQVFEPSAGEMRSLIGLLKGKVHALVSEYYGRAGARFEIKTPTAVCGVRGTEFSVVYQPDDEETEVVGISGIVAVHSLVDPTGPGVLVTANEITTVVRGQLPSQPGRLEEGVFQQHLQGIEFIGASSAASLSGSHPVVSGSGVPRPDQAPTLLTGTGMGAASDAPELISAGRKDASSIVGQSPASITAGSLGIDLGTPK